MFQLLKYQQLVLKVSKHSKYPKVFASTQPVVKPEQTEDTTENAIKSFEKITQITQKVRRRRPERPPFVKNMLLGVYDTELLAFSEVLNKEEQSSLDADIEPVQKYYSKPQQSQNVIKGISRDFMENARQLKMLGLQVPQDLNGREMNITESARFNEIISGDCSDINLICSESFGVQTLLKLGNEKQRKKYLGDVALGNAVIGFCMIDNDINENEQFKTVAVHDPSKDVWVINGEKPMVINGNTADLFIVCAKTEILNRMGLKEMKNSIFLVERTFGGVTSAPCNTLGLDKTDISTVKFTNTIIPAENVVGNLNEAENMLVKILPEIRLNLGICSTSITKNALNEFVKFCKRNSTETHKLIEADMIHQKISEIAVNLYAMESLNYFTAGIMDRYENQDVEMETAIVKAFNSLHCEEATLSCMKFIGSGSFLNDNQFNKFHKNALAYVTLLEASDNLKILIALQGLQFAGLKLQDEIMKIRNPLFYGTYILKRMFKQRRQYNDNPKLVVGLLNYLHPSLSIAANWLEYCVLRLQYATETMLGRYGIEVVSKHMQLIRLADSIIDIYAMSACLARASRSYCIGLQHAELEVFIANVFCQTAMQRVKNNINNICDGEFVTQDGSHKKIAERIFDTGQYFPVHPLTKNF